MDKNLYCFPTNKWRIKIVFIGRTMLGSVFGRESVGVYNVFKDGILT
jgi:hypothetical protein